MIKKRLFAGVFIASFFILGLFVGTMTPAGKVLAQQLTCVIQDRGDVNCSDQIDIFDLNILIANFGMTADTAATNTPTPTSGGGSCSQTACNASCGYSCDGQGGGIDGGLCINGACVCQPCPTLPPVSTATPTPTTNPVVIDIISQLSNGIQTAVYRAHTNDAPGAYTLDPSLVVTPGGSIQRNEVLKFVTAYQNTSSSAQVFTIRLALDSRFTFMDGMSGCTINGTVATCSTTIAAGGQSASTIRARVSSSTPANGLISQAAQSVLSSGTVSDTFTYTLALVGNTPTPTQSVCSQAACDASCGYTCDGTGAGVDGGLCTNGVCVCQPCAAP